DMLYQYDVPVPPFTFDKLLANLGKMSNQGVEFGLGVTAISHKDMELNVNLNLSFQKNKLISLSGNYNGYHLTAPDITAFGSLSGAGFHGGENNIVYQIVGQPVGVFYLPHCKGLVKNENGSYMYDIEDLDHNGRVNIEDGGDRYIAGQATPKWTLGSNISFRYKDFDISLQMNGAFGHKIYNGTALTYMNMSSFPDYNVMKKAPSMNIKDQRATDYWLERGDYLNFDYLTVGWNVPLHSRYISRLRLSASVNNLATITAYSGLTPMINSYVVDSTLGIDDKRSYPVYRTFSFGVSIQF
ncbi:MAG: SusC/RagA family TonB-linked outer membrane protein, partial [Prevotella sp.]|nr:SusC/RagA family TonB-linked outer membrane protein [Prevotella sp.]